VIFAELDMSQTQISNSWLALDLKLYVLQIKSTHLIILVALIVMRQLMLTHNKLSVLLIVAVQIRSNQLTDHVVLLVHHIPEHLTTILYARLNNVTSMKSS